MYLDESTEDGMVITDFDIAIINVDQMIIM